MSAKYTELTEPTDDVRLFLTFCEIEQVWLVTTGNGTRWCHSEKQENTIKQARELITLMRAESQQLADSNEV